VVVLTFQTQKKLVRLKYFDGKKSEVIYIVFTQNNMKKPLITYSDFQKIDIRVGKIISVENVEKSNKLLKLTVDLGVDYAVVTILSGIKDQYKPNQLKGKKCFFVANLEPRTMFGYQSQGMILVYDLENNPIVINAKKIILSGTPLA